MNLKEFIYKYPNSITYSIIYNIFRKAYNKIDNKYFQ